jgi:hypothetical protein
MLGPPLSGSRHGDKCGVAYQSGGDHDDGHAAAGNTLRDCDIDLVQARKAGPPMIQNRPRNSPDIDFDRNFGQVFNRRPFRSAT